MGKRIFNVIRRIAKGILFVMYIGALSLGGLLVYEMLTNASGWTLAGYIALCAAAFAFGALSDD